MTDCPVTRCFATDTSSQGQLCGSYGHSSDSRCVIAWITGDPEDLEPYADYIRDQRARTTPTHP